MVRGVDVGRWRRRVHRWHKKFHVAAAQLDEWLGRLWNGDSNQIEPLWVGFKNQRLWVRSKNKNEMRVCQVESIDYVKREYLTTNYQILVQCVKSGLTSKITPCWKNYSYSELEEQPERPLMICRDTDIEITPETHNATLWAQSLRDQKNTILRQIFDLSLPVHGLPQIILSFLLLS